MATPATLVKYTSNYRGAMYGWASTKDQVGVDVPGEIEGIQGLFHVGHWSDVPTGHSGVATVVASGRAVARRVLKNYGKERRSRTINCSNFSDRLQMQGS